MRPVQPAPRVTASPPDCIVTFTRSRFTGPSHVQLLVVTTEPPLFGGGGGGGGEGGGGEGGGGGCGDGGGGGELAGLWNMARAQRS
jgi:hypothetical protein